MATSRAGSARVVVVSLAVVISALILTGCTAPLPAVPAVFDSNDGPIDLRGEWRLTSASDGSGALAIPDTAVSMQFANGSGIVRTGCFLFIPPSKLRVPPQGANFVKKRTPQCSGLGVQQRLIDRSDVFEHAVRAGDSLTLETATGLVVQFSLVPALTISDIAGSWDLRTEAVGEYGWGSTGRTLKISPDGLVTADEKCTAFKGELFPVSGTNRISSRERIANPGTVCTFEVRLSDILLSRTYSGGFLLHRVGPDLALVSTTTDTTLFYSPAL